MKSIQNRYEFVLFFDVENGNPNGDPDAGNMPRIDAETSHGIVTDVCLKRKIRNFVDLTHDNESPYKIHIREGSFLNDNLRKAHKEVEKEGIAYPVPKNFIATLKDIKLPHSLSVKETENGVSIVHSLTESKSDIGKEVKKLKIDDDLKNFLLDFLAFSKEQYAQKWMCANYYDVRTFGAVMSTGEFKCGQVRGSVQINFAKSVEPVMPTTFSLAHIAAPNRGDSTGLGAQKNTVPYGLYRAEGYISAHFAERTGFMEEDLELLWQALINMFDHDHSAARGKMNARKLIIFKHDSKLGNAPAHKLFDLVKVQRMENSQVIPLGETSAPARAFSQYNISISSEETPEGVEIIEKL